MDLDSTVFSREGAQEGAAKGYKSEAARPQKSSSDSGGAGFCFARMDEIGKHGIESGCGGVFEGGLGVVAKGDGHSLREG